jgi:hypothetical protein
MSLVASLVRHINAEATFVTVLEPHARAQERTAALRRLLDTRAQVRASHGLDLRTEVREGEVSAQLRELATGDDPALLVLGLSGPRHHVEETLLRDVGWLFGGGPQCPLLVAHDDTLPALAAVAL